MSYDRVMNRTRQTAVILLLNLCWATYGADTSFLVYVSRQEAAIAADSLSNGTEGSTRMVCKMVQSSDHMLAVAEVLAKRQRNMQAMP
jgi:hypothetical protein